MNNFNIGDTVKYIGNNGYDGHPPKGSVGAIISQATVTNHYKVSFNGYIKTYWVHSDNLTPCNLKKPKPKTNNRFKVGDKVRIINHDNEYFNYKAEIIETDSSNIPYNCEIQVDNNTTKTHWYKESSLQLLKNPEKYFTISIRKHKRINLNFNL